MKIPKIKISEDPKILDLAEEREDGMRRNILGTRKFEVEIASG